MYGVAKKVIKGEERGERSIFAILKAMRSKILYKSNYLDIPTGLLVYLPKTLPVRISKILMSVWQIVWIRTDYQLHWSRFQNCVRCASAAKLQSHCQILAPGLTKYIIKKDV